ncbi:MAG: carboxypeptidase regulatory-like domain-containing protein [Acidobacteriia bacterium]|nr:carboxypeptidase regulatory-like domain-containing protein [Terriglobia bacterium]
MRRILFLVGILAGLFCTGVLDAQTPNASLTGRVTDPSKAVIDDAHIVAINVGTDVRYEGATNGVGEYYIQNLPPATYHIELEKIGFNTVLKPDVVLHVQEAMEINFEMTVGSVSENVTVEGGAPTVQLVSSALGTVVDSTTIRELPLNGRSWTDLATLEPGVNAMDNRKTYVAGSGRGNRGYGDQLTISGGRPQQNNYRLDGVNVSDYANGGPGNVLGGNLGVDAIQEFSVLTSNSSAEYGRTSGGVISAITRSGTNQFHGSGYEFWRNSALDARNFFDGSSIPPFQRHQFGGAAGGPIWKDHTFIFGDYEGIRQSEGITSIATVLSPAARNGNLVSGTVTVDPAAQKYLTFWPLPNGAVSGDTGTYTFAGQQNVTENFFTVRLDHKLSSKDTFFTSYFYDNSVFSAPDNLNDVLLGQQPTRHFAALEETHTFSPNLTNTFRFGFNRESASDNQTVKAINPAAADTFYAAVPGAYAAPVSIGGISGFKGGLGGGSPWLYAWNSFQASDDVSFTKGNHSLKFGFVSERMQVNMIAMSDMDGGFKFASIADFFANKPKSFLATLPGLLTPRDIRQTLFGGYVQDDWRFRHNLTLNLGLRYEMTTVPTEVQGKLSSLVNMTDAQAHLGSPFFANPTLHNFEPRLGFAWDPFSNGKTAVRGSFGMYDVLPLPYQFTLLTTRSAPFYIGGATSSLPQGSFYTGAISDLQTSSHAATYIEQNPKRNYVMQWNLNIQREIAPRLTATLGYVGSHGVHNPFRIDDTNIVLPTLTSAGYLWPSPVGSGTLLNPNYGQIRSMWWAGSSLYHALELGVTKQMSKGLLIRGSFTWSKSIDDSSSTVAGDAFANSPSSLHWANATGGLDLKQNRGLSDFNVGRTLVIAGTWQVPDFKSASGPTGWLLNGWALSTIFKASDGVPFTPTFGTNGGDPLGLNSSDPWAYPNRLSGPGCQSLVNPGNPNNYIKTQCFAIPTAPSAAFYAANCDPHYGTYPQCFNLGGNAGRNILIGPGLTNLDFAVFKNFSGSRISETFHVQFRAEIFNILNHPNFAVPVTPDNTDIFNADGTSNSAAGALTSTITSARQIQLGIKVIW